MKIQNIFSNVSLM